MVSNPPVPPVEEDDPTPSRRQVGTEERDRERERRSTLDRETAEQLLRDRQEQLRAEET